MNRVYWIIILIFFFFSCKKPFERRCFKSTGEGVAKEVVLTSKIDSLFLFGNIEYTIIPSSYSKVVLVGGKNLVSLIDVDEDNHGITIRDDNKCEFLRSYKDKVKANIYIDSIRYIEFGGSQYLKSQDTIRSYELRVIVKDCSGSLDLKVKNGYMSMVIANEYADFKLAGSTLIGFLNCRSNSYGDARNFTAKNKLIVNSNSVGDMYINANTDFLDVSINSKGNINYIGHPVNKSVSKSGKGNLIYIGN
ncbi:MAG: DUF2807 domain-containing protein [Brumimicrobium sp.]|nr:DUF2807 domain-containing protein [Brumimicrobium sp.]MCO5269990.1 DUF2807 domain-containing protein [Brumimicrobium sp.]